MAMAPWEQLPYFQTPVFTTVSVTSTAKQLIAADPMRVLLMFATTASGAFAVSPLSNLTITTGIGFATNGPPLILNQSWFGPLVSMAWYGIATPSANITVVSVAMIKWPDETSDTRVTPDAIAAAIRRLSRPV